SPLRTTTGPEENPVPEVSRAPGGSQGAAPRGAGEAGHLVAPSEVGVRELLAPAREARVLELRAAPRVQAATTRAPAALGRRAVQAAADSRIQAAPVPAARLRGS